MKCASCGTRKGKRSCKLTPAGFVCSACCASAQRDECSGCDYHESSVAYQRQKRLRSNTFTTEIKPEVDKRCDEALALVERGDMPAGRAALEELRREFPNYHMVLYGIGVCHCLADEVDEAIACLERAVEIFPILASAHYNLGGLYCLKVDIENAVKSYQTAIDVDGSDGSVGGLARKKLEDLDAMTRKNGIDLPTYLDNKRTFDRGFAALQAGQYQAAIDLFGQVFAREKGHVQSYGNMGLAYAALGNRRMALQCLDKALELDPDYEPAIVNRRSAETMKDGEPIAIDCRRDVDYYRDYRHAGRSYVEELAQDLEEKAAITETVK
jgi:tetratricopeptide (TPR) repeat protein